MIRKAVYSALKKLYKIKDPNDGMILEEMGIDNEGIFDVLDLVAEKIDFDFDPGDEEPITVGDLIELIEKNLC